MSADRKIENAIIESTMLGYEDHGILTVWIQLSMNGTGQGFGGFSMDTPIPTKPGEKFNGRQGTAFGCDFIIKVMQTVGVERWESLKGKHVRVDHDFGHVYRIGNIIKDEWFDPALLSEYHKNKTFAEG